jgi:hypothetical protein
LSWDSFAPDPDLQKCLCAGYLRSKIEPFVSRVEAGKASLGKPEGSYKALVFEAQKMLTTAKAPRTIGTAPEALTMAPARKHFRRMFRRPDRS